MNTKVALFFIIFIFCALSMSAQDKRTKIKDYLNQEILIEDNFSGQSITLIKENNDYFILRKFFGSGVPVAGSAKYKVVFKSEYQIGFSETIEPLVGNSMINCKEDFLLCAGENGLCLYLNRLKVVINEKRL